MMIEGTTSDGTRKDVPVDPKGWLHTDAKAEGAPYHVARDDARVFRAVSIDTAAAGEYTFYLRNDDTERDLVIRSIRCGNVVTTLYKLLSVTGTAAGGSALTPGNSTVGSPRTADVTCRGDGAITGLTAAATLGILRVNANESDAFEIHDDVRIPQGQAVAVESDTTAGGIEEIEAIFFFEPAV